MQQDKSKPDPAADTSQPTEAEKKALAAAQAQNFMLQQSTDLMFIDGNPAGVKAILEQEQVFRADLSVHH